MNSINDQFETRCCTFVVQRTQPVNDAFQHDAQEAMRELFDASHKAAYGHDPRGLRGDRGTFTASNGCRIDWIASIFDPPREPEGDSHG